MERKMYNRLLLALGLSLLLGQAPARAGEPEPASSRIVPFAQIIDDEAGEAFVDQEITVEATFLGMASCVSPSGDSQLPRAYRKTHSCFAIGRLGSLGQNLAVATGEEPGRYFVMELGTTLRITGMLMHSFTNTPKLGNWNRILIATKVEAR